MASKVLPFIAGLAMLALFVVSFAKFGEMIGVTGLLGVALPMLVLVAALVGLALASNLARRDPARFARLGQGR
jgi:hypothetical protein